MTLLVSSLAHFLQIFIMFMVQMAKDAIPTQAFLPVLISGVYRPTAEYLQMELLYQ